MYKKFLKQTLAIATTIVLSTPIELTNNIFNNITANAVTSKVLSGTPYRTDDMVYDVKVPHVIINQFYGASKSYSTHSFIELYNPTDQDVDLSSWSLQYISSVEGSYSAQWSKLNLNGVIPSHCSYLVRCGRVGDTCSIISLNDQNSYDIDWEQTIYTKGGSVALIANQQNLPVTDIYNNDLSTPVVADFVDLLSASGNDAISEQQALFYEYGSSPVQSKKKGIRRNSFTDTDNNQVGKDSIIADYSFENEKYISWISPKSVKYGAWENNNAPTYTVTYNISETLIQKDEFPLYTTLEPPAEPKNGDYVFVGWYSDPELTQKYEFGDMPATDITLYAKWLSDEKEILIDKINKRINDVPKYYNKYYTENSAAQVSNILASIKDTDVTSQTADKLQNYFDILDTAISGLKYKTGTVPQIFISTQNENGNTIDKAAGYQDTSIVFSSNDQELIQDNDGLIKVRGNSTSLAAKKPFTIKFSSKNNLCGMGKAKKYCLLANCFDPTLLRNYVAMNLGLESGLDYTPEQQFVELWIDGIYKGCYLMTEDVEVEKSRVDIDIENGDFLIMYEQSRLEPDTTYITSTNGLRFEVKEPETPDGQQLKYIQDTVNSIDSAINSNDFEKIKTLMDVDSIAKLSLINEFMKTHDISYSSVYFYFKNGKLYGGPLWDFDLSSGNAGTFYAKDQDNLNNPNRLMAAYSPLFSKLLKYDEFKNKLFEVFQANKDILQNVSAENGLMDTALNKYRPVFDKNFSDAGWSVSGVYSALMRAPESTYDKNFDNLKQWFEKRYSFLSGYYTDLHNQTCAKLTGHSLTLNGDIGVNFYVKLNEKYRQPESKAYFTISYKGQVVRTIPAKDITDRISYNVSADSMAEDVTINFYESENTASILTNSYSVDKYITDSKATQTSQTLKKLMESMQTYGKYADKYFNNTTASLGDVNADLSSIEDIKIAHTNNPAAKYYGSSVILNSKNTLRFYFEVSEGSHVTATLNGQQATVYTKGHLYYVEVPEISSHRLNNRYTLEVKCGDDVQLTVTDSVLSYCKRTSSLTDDADLRNVVKSIYNYYAAATAYNESINN